MSTLREHIERAERSVKATPGIEPENYVPAPAPPAPVEYSGIGRKYLPPWDLPIIQTHGCTQCGAMVHSIVVHERWHGGLAA